jgi:hypothetical protein
MHPKIRRDLARIGVMRALDLHVRACSTPIARIRIIGESASWRGIDEPPSKRWSPVPQLTRSADIKLNQRVSLLELIEIDNNNVWVGC